MPESTSTDYRLNAICPKCGELQTIVITIKSTVKEVEEEKETEGKDNDNGSNNQASGTAQAESADVRLAHKKRFIGATGETDKPTDSGKSRPNSSTGGEKAK